MSAETSNNRKVWGILLLIGALGCASMRNNPAWGMAPFAIGIIEAGIYACLMAAMRLSCWQASAGIGIIVPIYLWSMRFLDGFMIPVEILIGLALMSCMYLFLEKQWNPWMGVLLLTAVGFAVMLLGSAAAICIVKQQNVIRAFITAWNTEIYSVFSILGAAAVCVPWQVQKSEP